MILSHFIYALYAVTHRLAIPEENLYLHATYHAPPIVFLGEDCLKFTKKLIRNRGERGSKFGRNGIRQLNKELKNG